MYNEILDAVISRLEDLFPDCSVYPDAMDQVLQKPCFVVSFMESSEKPMTGRRYYRETKLHMQYLPGPAEQVFRELNQAADLLLDGMETIVLEKAGVMRGTERSCRMQGGVLDFSVNYNSFVIKKKNPEPAMETIDVSTDMKG